MWRKRRKNEEEERKKKRVVNEVKTNEFKSRGRSDSFPLSPFFFSSSLSFTWGGEKKLQLPFKLQLDWSKCAIHCLRHTSTRKGRKSLTRLVELVSRLRTRLAIWFFYSLFSFFILFNHWHGERARERERPNWVAIWLPRPAKAFDGARHEKEKDAKRILMAFSSKSLTIDCVCVLNGPLKQPWPVLSFRASSHCGGTGKSQPVSFVHPKKSE